MIRNWRWLTLLFLLVGCSSVPTTDLPTATLPVDEEAGVTSTWIRFFEGEDYGAFFDIALTQDNGLIVVGATNHLHLPPYTGDALYMKLSLEGDVLWERTWGGEGYE